MYEVLTPSLVFDITVEILKRGRNMWHGKTEHATWNKVSTFQISPSVPALTSPDGKVIYTPVYHAHSPGTCKRNIAD